MRGEGKIRRFIAPLAAIVVLVPLWTASAVPAAAGFRAPAPSVTGEAQLLSPKMRVALRASTRRRLDTPVPQLPTSPGSCNGTWSAVASPDASAGHNVINGMAAASLNDVWAVGFYVNGSGVFQTLSEHWDGSTWNIVPSISVGGGNNLFTAVTAMGPSDVWAVGYWRTGDGSTAAQPLTEHWNGNSWSIIGAPEVANTSTLLNAISADASNDVWTVGISINYPVQSLSGQAFAMQWNGSGWSIVPTANLVAPIAGPGIDLVGLNGVKVISPTNAWTVGDGADFTGTSQASPDMSFIEHWNGSNWGQIPSPTHPNGDFLSDVQGTASDLWAVGGQGQGGSSTSDNVLIEHNTGTGWNDVSGITPGLSANLFALGYLSSSNVYAVGASAYSNPGTNAEQDNTLIEKWDGASWTQQTSVNPTTSQDLTTIAAIAPGDVWSGGFITPSGFDQTLTENLCTRPAVTSIAPASGNGGDTVMVNGSGFTGAVDVEFGATPAFSYHVVSDTQIAAIAPWHRAGIVDVTVTVEGTSLTSSADQFAYQLAHDPATTEPSGTAFRLRSPPPGSTLVLTINAIRQALLGWMGH